MLKRQQRSCRKRRPAHTIHTFLPHLPHITSRAGLIVHMNKEAFLDAPLPTLRTLVELMQLVRREAKVRKLENSMCVRAGRRGRLLILVTCRPPVTHSIYSRPAPGYRPSPTPAGACTYAAADVAANLHKPLPAPSQPP